MVTVRKLEALEKEVMYDLRNRVLRPGFPPDAVRYEGDDDAGTIHLGAFDTDNRLVGITSLYAAKGTQLRGMAVEPEWRGQGVGASLLRQVHQLLRENRGVVEPLWCNAREVAVGFYESLGWRVESEKFALAHVGPHYIMRYAPEETER